MEGKGFVAAIIIAIVAFACMKAIDRELGERAHRHASQRAASAGEDVAPALAELPRGILDLEFAWTSNRFGEIRDAWTADGTTTIVGDAPSAHRLVSWSLFYDLFFIVGYVSFLIGCFRFVRSRRDPDAPAWRPIARAIIVAGACDVIENIALAFAFVGLESVLLVLGGLAATIKFAAIGVVVAYLGWKLVHPLMMAEQRPRTLSAFGEIIGALLVMRVPIIGGLIVFAAPSAMATSKLVANLHLLESKLELYVVGLAAGFAAITCVSNAFLALRYAPSRFGLRLPCGEIVHGSEPSDLHYVVSGCISFLLAIPTAANMRLDAAWFSPFIPLVTMLGISSSVSAVLIIQRSTVKHTVTKGLFRILRHPIASMRGRSAGGAAGATLSSTTAPGWIVDGYVDPSSGRVHPGHVGAFVGWLMIVVIYFLADRLEPDSGFVDGLPVFAALCATLSNIVATLSGVAFFFDRLRIPVVILAIIWSMVAGHFSKSTHYFLVKERTIVSARSDDRDEQREPDVIDEQRLRMQQTLSPAREQIRDAFRDRNSSRPRVVVCAAGGGIQAAAWTAKVLTELEREMEISRRINLISSVSGGTIGSMYFVEAIRRNDGNPLGEERQRAVLDAAMASSLKAVGWALAFKDLRRVMNPFRGVIDLHMDRGIALERKWRLALDGEEAPLDATLGDWAQDVRKGKLPAVVFNATIGGVGATKKKGERLLLSTLPKWRRGTSDALNANSFFDIFDNGDDHYDIPIVTAARLSASFPVVTPMARAGIVDESGDVVPLGKRRDTDSALYIADGGYFDNLGLATAMEWLTRLLERNGTPGPIAFVFIRPFPDEPPVNSVEAESTRWINAAAGPLDLLLATWERTQVERASIEMGLLDLLQSRQGVMSGGNAKTDADRDESVVRKQEHQKPALRIKSFTFVPEDVSEPAPLSWHLSRRQKAAVEQSYGAKCREQAKALAAFLE